MADLVIERNAAGQKRYRPDGEVLRQFLASRREVDIIRGPIGSGTSSASIMRLWSHAIEQKPGPDNIRRTRWAVIRDTFPNLKETTIKTWEFWFEPELYGQVNYSRPMTHVIDMPVGVDKEGNVVPGIHVEVMFLALDDEKDIAKLRSLELTGAWINEVEFTLRSIFDEVHSRCGRYPAMILGGPTWSGVIADMNAPPEDHWIPWLMGEVPLPMNFTEEQRKEWEKPDGDAWGYHIQPPGLLEKFDGEGKVVGYEETPLAENRKYLKPGYYLNLTRGKRKSWIDSRIMNRITLHVEGDPVWPTFRPEVHVSRTAIPINRNYPVHVGLDFGRNPAAIFGQEIGGRLYVQRELIGSNEGASRFAPKVKRTLEQDYAGCKGFYLYGDPKGQDRGQGDERTAYEIFRAFGLVVRAVSFVRQVNAISVRIEAVDHILGRTVDAYPAFLVDGLHCRMLKMAMAGAYHWGTSGDGRKEPVKDLYSNPADAAQYLVLGLGEGRIMINLPGQVVQARPHIAYATRRIGGRRGQDA